LPGNLFNAASNFPTVSDSSLAKVVRRFLGLLLGRPSGFRSVFWG
jgi:hypothetical protein